MENDTNFIDIISPTSHLNQIEERDNIEYKTQLDETKKGQSDFLKDYAAIANSGGGLIIYGVNGNDLVGISDQDLGKYDSSRLHDKLIKNLSPVPQISTLIVLDQNKKYVFVKIASIENSPILISKNMHDQSNNLLLAEGGLYIRHNTQTKLASSESQMRNVLDKIINRNVNSKLKQLLPILSQLGSETITTIDIKEQFIFDAEKLGKERVKIQTSTPTRQVILTPKNRKEKYPLEKLKNAFCTKISLKGYKYPHYGWKKKGVSDITKMNNGYFSWWGENALDREWRCFSRMLDNGCFIWMGTLIEDDIASRQEQSSDKFNNKLGIMLTQYFVQLSLFHAKEYISRLEDTGIWTLTYSLNNISGRILLVESFDRMEFWDDKKAFENNIEIKIDFKLVDLEEKMEFFVVDITSKIFERFNWADVNIDQIKKDFNEYSKHIGSERNIYLD